MTYVATRGWRLTPVPVDAPREISPESSREDLKRASSSVPLPVSRFKVSPSSSAPMLPIAPVVAQESNGAGLASSSGSLGQPGAYLPLSPTIRVHAPDPSPGTTRRGPGAHVVHQKGSTPGPLVAKKGT